MENKKKSFVLYHDTLDVLDMLSDEQAGKLFKGIKNYQTGTEPELDALLSIVFLPFKKQFIRDGVKYENTVERNKENGKKGGRPKKTQDNPKNPVGYLETQKKPNEPRKADSDSDSVNDNDSVNVNDIDEEPILPKHQVTENQGTVIQSTVDQVTEIQLTGVQFTGDQGVNKVITEQSNNLQSNKKQRNNIIPKEDNFRDEHYEAFSLDTVPQLMLWCFEHNREFNNCTPNGILYDKSYYKLSIEEKQLHLMNLTKELQTN
jgi:hypothetical protein